MRVWKPLAWLATVLASLVLFAGCATQENINASNEMRIKMVGALTNAMTAVAATESGSDDLALGFLIGSGAFNIQNADTFKDYAYGAGYFARAFLPWLDLFYGSAGYEGLNIESNGGDVIFHGTKSNGDLNQLYGNDNAQTRSEYVTPVE